MKNVDVWQDAVQGAKRELILHAARYEFMENGLEGATMRAIAHRAGCTTGAIYPLFGSKELIYAALLERSLLALDAAIAGAIAPSMSAAQKVRAASEAFLHYYLEHQFEVNLGLYAFRGLKRQGVGKHSDRRLNDLLDKALHRIAEPLAEVRADASSRVKPLVALLFSQMIGALVLQFAGRLDLLGVSPRELLKLSLNHLLSDPPMGRTTRRASGKAHSPATNVTRRKA